MRVVRRWHSPSVFTIVALCFVLPFATVTLTTGCEGGDELVAKTSFTGMQLVTRAVPRATVAQPDVRSPQLPRDVERAGSLPAEVAFGAAIAGLALGLIGVVGGGWCALVGLGALIQIFISLEGIGSEPNSTLHLGYGLTFGFFCWAGVLHFYRWRKRGPRFSTGPGFGGAIAAMVVSVAALVVAGLCLWQHVLWLTPILWAGAAYLMRVASERRLEVPGSG